MMDAFQQKSNTYSLLHCIIYLEYSAKRVSKGRPTNLHFWIENQNQIFLFQIQ